MNTSNNLKIYKSTEVSCGVGSQLLSDSDFCDVTLVCADNQHLPAHRAVLCSNSSFLRELLYDSQQQRTFLYLGSVQSEDLMALLEVMYLGSSSIKRDRMEVVLALAAGLGVPGVLQEVLEVTAALPEKLDGEEGGNEGIKKEGELNEGNRVFPNEQPDCPDKQIILDVDLDLIEFLQKESERRSNSKELYNKYKYFQIHGVICPKCERKVTSETEKYRAHITSCRGREEQE